METRTCIAFFSVLSWSLIALSEGFIYGPNLLDHYFSPKSQVHMAWSDWTTWSHCSRTCGGGVSMRTRVCKTRLGVSFIGQPTKCLGDTVEYRICQRQACPPYTQDFRDYQCSVQRGHQAPGSESRWLPYTGGSNPCELQCQSDGESSPYSFGKVWDGTSCANNKVCVNGRCMDIGCDGRVGVEIKVDMCGVCGGRNESCLHVKEIYRGELPRGLSKNSGSYDYHQVAVIPEGAYHVTIYDASNHFLALVNADGEFLISGRWRVDQPGRYNAGGSTVTYTRTWDNNETINIPGPTNQDLQILILGNGQLPEIEYEYWIKEERYRAMAPTAFSHPESPNNVQYRMNNNRIPHSDLNPDYFVPTPQVNTWQPINRHFDRRPYSLPPLINLGGVRQPVVVGGNPEDGYYGYNLFRNPAYNVPHYPFLSDDAFPPRNDRYRYLEHTARVLRSEDDVYEGHSKERFPKPNARWGHLRSDERDRSRPQKKRKSKEERKSKETKKGGSCYPCPKAGQISKHYCDSDFVLRATVQDFDFRDNRTRYVIEIIQSFKNKVDILPKEYLWNFGACRCPKLQRNQEYIIIGKSHSYSRSESRLIIDKTSYVRKYNRKRSRAIMKVRRDQDRVCRRIS